VPDQFTTEVDLAAPAEEVFRHLTDPGAISWGVAGNAGLPPGATEVEFTLTPIPGGTRLRLVHRGLPPDEAQLHATGWPHFLARLAISATGADPGPDPWGE
jgi:uncharacterized protein YndB with AHSA1/START domain